MTALPGMLASARIPEGVERVLKRLAERGFQAFLVGGCVRDLVRGVAPKDFDVATSALPDEVVRSFPKVIPTGIQHGTVTVLSQGLHVEVTTFRTEGDYLDGRRPSSVEFHTDIEADLSRRDFTINAMAFNPVTGELCDPFGGRVDLEAKLVRCVGRALDRFSEDGLRALRAVRFATVLGFRIEPGTLDAIGQTLSVFRRVSVERIREEFVKILLSPRATSGLELLHSTGLLREFLPEVTSVAPRDWSRTLRTVGCSPAVLEIRLAALLHGLAAGAEGPEAAGAASALTTEVLARLRFPNKVIEQGVHLVRWQAIDGPSGWTDADVRRFLARIGPEHLHSVLASVEAIRRGAGQAVEDLQQLRDRADAILARGDPLSARALALGGREIMSALGVGPSPIVGQATRFLVDQVLDRPELNEPQVLTALLHQWATERSAG